MNAIIEDRGEFVRKPYSKSSQRFERRIYLEFHPLRGEYTLRLRGAQKPVMQNSKRRSRLSHQCARGKKHSVLEFLLAGHHEHNCNLRRQNRTTEHQGISSLDNSASRFYIGLPNLLQFYVPLCSDSNCLWLRSST